MSDKKPIKKKRNLESTPKFTSAEQIRQSLRAQTLDGVVEALNQLRNQLTIRSDEGMVSPQDERLILVEQWLANSPGAQDVFGLWENANHSSLLVAIVAVLGVIITLLSSHYTYHAIGQPVVKGLLTSQWMRRLNSYLGGAHNELTLVTLKLMNAISEFAGGREKKSLLEAFQWEIKSLPKLLTLRRRGKVDYNPLARPDIRTLYILLLLSFLNGPPQVKITFLEQHRDAFSAIFKGLYQDHYALIRYFLETIWANLWSDPKVKRTLKVGLFNESCISHLLKIYERTSSDDGDLDHIPADLVHHFLLAIMTRPGIGICFKDRGWYPRDDPGDEKGSKIHNKIIGNVLKTLKVNEDSRQQELARKILEACPELVATYWPSAQLTLEPRLSTKWIANITFLGTILSLPIPQSTFYLPGTDLYNPVPPPLQTILSNILPFDISPRTIFTKGLLSQSGLVQHCTAQTLIKCLAKYAKVLDTFRLVENVLEGKDTEEGLWAKRRKEIEKEVRRRVPEFQVVLGFSQPKSPVQVVGGQNVPALNHVRKALLQESAQRLLLLYHKHLPEVVSEARFDVGKLLVNFDASVVDVQESEHDTPDAVKRLHMVQKLHIIRTLKESDQFVWTNKTASSHTHFYSILKSYITTFVPSLKSALLDLLSHLLSSSILFENTPNEPLLWFTSISNLTRIPDAKSPDNAILTDETECVMNFLDDCIQRCLKTFFRYLDEMHDIQTSSPNSLAEIYPSPLIMTLGEQFDAKMKAGLLIPSDVLAIASFTRKLLFRLMGQVQRLTFLEAFVVRLDHVLSEDRLWVTEYPSMTIAVRMEVEMMYMVIRPAKVINIPANPNPSLHNYLNSVDALLPTAKETREQEFRAYSIIDRLRFLEQPLSLSDAKRIILAVQSRWAPALQTLAQHLIPRCGSLWVNRVLVRTDIGKTIPIEWLFFNATKEQILDSNYRRDFVAAVFSTKPNLQSCIRLIRHFEHALNTTESSTIRALLSLLAIFLGVAKSNLSDPDMVELKEILFVYPSGFKRLALSHELDDQVFTGLYEVLQNSFDPSSRADSRVLSDITTHWAALLQNRLIRNDCNLNLAALWIKYMPTGSLLSLLDELMSEDIMSRNPAFVPLIQSILDDIRSPTSEDFNIKDALYNRSSQLLRIRQLLPNSPVVEEVILSVINSTLPIGISGPPQQIQCDNPVPLSVEMQQARSCWSRRFLRLDHFSVYDFITADHWTPSTSKIIASLMYKQGLFDVPMFETWLKSEHSTSRSQKDLSIVIQAALDIHQFASRADNSLNPPVWIPHLKNIGLLCFDHDVDDHLCQKATSCVTIALTVFAEYKKELVQVLLEQIELRRPKHPPPLVSIRFGFQVSEITVLLLEWSLQWLISQLADDTMISNQKCRLIEATTSLVHLSTPKIYQVETLLGVIFNHHLHHPCALELANACISKINLKPVVVNRYLQSILHHPQFTKVSGVMSSYPEARSKIIDLLHTFFNLHPTNTCQSTQVEPILRIYGGTLSKEDLLLFSIFQLFEVHRKTSLASLFKVWSSSYDVTCSSPRESLQTLDTGRVFQTTLHYPKWRKLNADVTSYYNDDSQLYDPIFLLLLYQLVLFQDPPTTPFEWIELFRTNIVGLCIRSLSSKDSATRTFSLCQLSSLYKLIENVHFQEKPHITYILNLLKDLLLPPSSPDDPPPRLPTYTTLILSHALRGIFYPSNFIYPLTARFLLQRPELDPSDVPMLYTMLYSNGDDWKKERGWIIRFLADGMTSFADWKILKRRHTWDLLASLFEGSRTDLALRRGVFEVLASLTSNRQAVTAMIFTSSFLPWLETQILQGHVDESLKWARVLMNTVLTVDHSKLDSDSKVSWRNCIYRCFCALLEKSNADSILPVIVIAMLKLGQTSKAVGSEAKECISLAARALELYETHLDVSGLPDVTIDDHPRLRYGLYSSRSIHEPINKPHSLATWFDCLTLLWRTVMTLNEKSSCWDELTFKLLASCNRVGLENAETRWIRKQAVLLQGPVEKTMYNSVKGLTRGFTLLDSHSPCTVED